MRTIVSRSAMSVELSKLSVYVCLIIVYVLPLSIGQSSNDSQIGNVYYWTRLIMVPLAVGALVGAKRQKSLYIEYAFLSIVALLIYLIHKEIPDTCVLLLVYIIVFDSLDGVSVGQITSTKFFKSVILFFLIQIILVTYLSFRSTQSISVMTSTQDRNYSAFFILILYFMIPSEPNRRFIQPKDVLLLLAILTFSRTGMIAAILIFIYNNMASKLKGAAISFISDNTTQLFVGIFIVWIIICALFCSSFNPNSYVYEYRVGFARFSIEGLFDYSNYIRAYSNIAAISNAGPLELLFGFSDAAWSNIVNFDGKAIFPHNLTLTIFVKGGILYTLAIVRRGISIFKGNKNASCLYIVFLVFSNILGPSLYYGADLILYLLAAASLKRQETFTSRTTCINEVSYYKTSCRHRCVRAGGQYAGD